MEKANILKKLEDNFDFFCEKFQKKRTKSSKYVQERQIFLRLPYGVLTAPRFACIPGIFKEHIRISFGKNLRPFFEDLLSDSGRSLMILSPTPFYWQISNKSCEDAPENISKTEAVFRRASNLTSYSPPKGLLKEYFE